MFEPERKQFKYFSNLTFLWGSLTLNKQLLICGDLNIIPFNYR